MMSAKHVEEWLARQRGGKEATVPTYFLQDCQWLIATLIYYLVGVCLLLVLFASPAAAHPSFIGPENVSILVNQESPTSRSIAHLYRRFHPGISESQIIYLSGLSDSASPQATPADEILTREQFESCIAQPVRDHLVAYGLVDQVYCLITTAGIPYRIEDSDPNLAQVIYPAGSSPTLTLDNRDTVDAASVEAELSILWQIDPNLSSEHRAPIQNRIINPYQGYCSPIKSWDSQRDLLNRRECFTWSIGDTVWLLQKEPRIEGEGDIFHQGCRFSALNRQMSPADIYLVARLDGPRQQGECPIFAVEKMLWRSAAARDRKIGYNHVNSNVVIDYAPNAADTYSYSNILNFPPQYTFLNQVENPTPPGAEEYESNFNEGNHYFRTYRFLSQNEFDPPVDKLERKSFNYGLRGRLLWDGTGAIMNQAQLLPGTGLLSLQTYGCNGNEGRPADYLTTAGPNGSFLFDCVPGAVFISLESFNAVTMFTDAATSQGKIAEFIDMGGSGAVGHAFEPVRGATIQGEFLITNLLRDDDDNGIGDFCLAEAVFSAMPYLSWAEVLIGDPLMRLRDGPGLIVNVPENPYDVNRDGVLNIKDLSQIKPALDTVLGDPGYRPKADVNKDGHVTIDDLSAVESLMAN